VLATAAPSDRGPVITRVVDALRDLVFKIGPSPSRSCAGEPNDATTPFWAIAVHPGSVFHEILELDRLAEYLAVAQVRTAIQIGKNGG
jgi:hypothetical protein